MEFSFPSMEKFVFFLSLFRKKRHSTWKSHETFIFLVPRSAHFVVQIMHIGYIRFGDFHLWVVPTMKTQQAVTPRELRWRTHECVHSHIRWPLDAKSLLPNFWYIEKMPRIGLDYLIVSMFIYHKAQSLRYFLTSRLIQGIMFTVVK